MVLRRLRDRRRAEARLEHQASHDLLTGLPNRARLHAAVDALVGEGASPTPFALLVLDLDRFKEINDTLGHFRGDLLLQSIGERLSAVLGQRDLLARLGDDEFAVLLPEADVQRAQNVTHQLLRALEQPFVLEGATLGVNASVGIAVYPAHGRDADTLLRHADMALYVAKDSRLELAVYAPEHDAHSPERLALKTELREAIQRDELVLHYQPQIDIRSGVLLGAEALVRWRHPEQGMLPPSAFVPLAEQTRLIRPLSRWLVRAALRQVAAWRGAGRDLLVTLNLSVYDLQDGRLVELIREQLGAQGVPADRVCLEITESALLADPRRASALVAQLRRLGVRIAIDDFGTGYSSLSYLKDLPVDELKIDQSFVRGMASDPGSRAIVRAVVDLAADLDLRVVAEGVEDRSTWEILAALGCDLAQGYYFLPPVPPDELPAWDRDTTPWLLDRDVGNRTEQALAERARARGARLAAEEAFLARKRAEAALAESEERLRLAAAAAGMGTWDVDVPTGAITLSPEMAALLGLPPGTQGCQMEEFLHRVEPEDVPIVQSRIREAAETFDLEFRLRSASGTVRWVGSSGRVFRSPAGQLERVIGASIDITQRKEAERQRERLAHTDKLRALGQMASGIAHDLNQSLALIAGFSEVAERALEHDPLDREVLREALATITGAALDGGRAVRGLLTFARGRAEGEREPVDAADLLRDVAALTAPRWRDAAQEAGRPIQLTLEAPGAPLTILGWPTALRDALMNLVFNAIDALPEGGTIRLGARAVGSEIVLEVSDTGIGMPPEVQERLFEPFFTTRGEGAAGLGLWQVFGIVERHAGRIEVDSAPGQGTTFRLSLPAAAPAETPNEAPGPPSRGTLGLRVLAVDDEPRLGKMLQRMLRPLQHTVVVAHSGEEALERLAAEPFDVLVSDLGMGAGMNGWELVERARQRCPGLRVVLATGWGAALDPAEARARGVDAIVAKPYRRAEIEHALAAWLRLQPL
jgi:diguanylate cyclase (GGDEF)-like protein/PAS domain S-box-containing protein